MDIQSNSSEYVFDQLNKKYGLSKQNLRMIVRTEFECVKHVMKKIDSYNDFWPYIRLPYLCVFMVKRGKRRFFRKRSLKILADVYSQSEQQSGDRAKDALDTGV